MQKLQLFCLFLFLYLYFAGRWENKKCRHTHVMLVKDFDNWSFYQLNEKPSGRHVFITINRKNFPWQNELVLSNKLRMSIIRNED